MVAQIQCERWNSCEYCYINCYGCLIDLYRYCDFFRFLYTTIQQKLQGELANRWEDANIEFIFSVPTTWKPVPTVERFRGTIERAGFGRFPNHKAIIGLTEAEAAAVHTARMFPKLFNVHAIPANFSENPMLTGNRIAMCYSFVMWVEGPL